MDVDPAEALLPAVLSFNVTGRRAALSRVVETDSYVGMVMIMRVFVAGGTGMLGSGLVPQSPACGYQVTATTTSAAGLGELARQGADTVLKAGGAGLRHGVFFGRGGIDDQVELVRKRPYPLVGRGTGYSTWVRLDDAAGVTGLAVAQKATGLRDFADGEPAPADEWLPHLAACVGAKRPMRGPVWLARLLAGDHAVVTMTEGRGFANTKAQREPGWQRRHPSWRQGFKEELA
jgi:nucleoside-diphosphate-sugar epimerase